MESSPVWSKDPQCRCSLESLWVLVGACGLCSEGVVLRIAQGPKVLVSAGVLEV